MTLTYIWVGGFLLGVLGILLGVLSKAVYRWFRPILLPAIKEKVCSRCETLLSPQAVRTSSGLWLCSACKVTPSHVQ